MVSVLEGRRKSSITNGSLPTKVDTILQVSQANVYTIVDGTTGDPSSDRSTRRKDNLVADYLSRIDDARIDKEVVDERGFEENIFTTRSGNLLQREVEAERTDGVISDALGQIRIKGKADSGQLKKVNKHLKVEWGTIFLKTVSCPETDVPESSRWGALAAPLQAEGNT